MKEIIISLIIIVIIFSLDIFTQNYTENSIEEIVEKLEDISKNLKEKDINQVIITEKSKEIEKNWKQKNSKMAIYIEHEELEKVETSITSMISYIESEEYTHALNQINTNIFILQHIKDKYRFGIENIF